MAYSGRDPRPASRPSIDFPQRRETDTSHRESESGDFLNESSPLLSPQATNDDHITREEIRTPSGLLEWNEGDEEQSKSVWYLFLLTLSIGG